MAGPVAVAGMSACAERLFLGALEGGEALHEAALAAGGVVAVNDALLRSPVEGADGGQGGGAQFLGGGFARGADGRAGLGADDLVADALALVGADALDGGSSVSQRKISSHAKLDQIERQCILMHRPGFV